MNKKEAKKYYMNMSIPFDKLKKPQTPIEEHYYGIRKVEYWRNAYKDGFDDEFDEDFSNENYKK